jgi:hypothetical protein
VARGARVRFLFTVTIFVSAALLFTVEPMFARMALPAMGGSPAVWNTALVFYQAVLLLGYVYAHAISRLEPRRQAEFHAVVLLLPVLVLPIAAFGHGAPAGGANPIPWFLGLLVTAVGLPFFVVSTGGSLLQRWFARSGDDDAHDPYFLYAASNLGSFTGLLAYPLVVEPFMTLRGQSLGWSAGYAVLAMLTLACAWVALTGKRRALVLAPAIVGAGGGAGATPHEAPALAAVEAPAPVDATGGPDAARKLRWVAWAFVPSSFLLGATTHLTTDVGSLPLLWVMPLALYLLTFTVAFARRPLVPRPLLLRALPFVLTILTVALASRANEPCVFILGLDLVSLAVVGLLFHGLLADDRPDPRHLTSFFLWVAVGGVLGGVFNALVAPLVFHSVLEYPIVVALACLLMPPRGGGARQRANALDFLLPAALFAVTLAAIAIARGRGLGAVNLAIFVLFAWPAFAAFTFSARPLRFGLAVAAVLLAAQTTYLGSGRLVHEDRSFYGVNRVFATPGHKHLLMHGSTVHGLQWIDPARQGEPLSYYTRSGPFGQLFAMERARAAGRPLRVGLVGLGAGDLAAYAEPGDTWTAFEIDPTVDAIARDPRWFTFLRDSRAPIVTVLGDGRLSLARDKDARFDVLVLDAYSSDAVPVHLLTREALELYLARLAPGGVLAFHVSNRHLDLRPVVAALTKDAKLPCLLDDDLTITPEEYGAGRFPTRLLVAARDRADLGALAIDPRWVTPPLRHDLHLWTDDDSSILPLIVSNAAAATPAR